MVRKVQYKGRTHYLVRGEYLLTKTELGVAQKRYRAKFGYRKKAVFLGGDLLGSIVIFSDNLVIGQSVARRARERKEWMEHEKIKKKARKTSRRK